MEAWKLNHPIFRIALSILAVLIFVTGAVMGFLSWMYDGECAPEIGTDCTTDAVSLTTFIIFPGSFMFATVAVIITFLTLMKEKT